MYKPPLNSNRVKSIKSKFENIDNEHQQTSFQATSSRKYLKSDLVEISINGKEPSNNLDNLPGPSNTKHPVLCRQLSDPSKRNIKRTHAFRVDKNLGNDLGVRQKINSPNKLFENKVKQFNSTKCFDKLDKSECGNNCKNVLELKQKDCNYSFNISSLNRSCDNVDNTNGDSPMSPIYKTDKITKPAAASRMPFLIKSKSSHDFQYIRNKFNNGIASPPKNHFKNINEVNKNLDDNVRENIPHINEANHTENTLLLKGVDLSLLYTEPIPKSLRNQNKNTISKGCTESHLKSIDSIYSKSTLQLTDSNKKEFIESLKQVLQQDVPGGLTDTLKVALSKPLPGGPAPQKPPRTFKYLAEAVIANNLIKNTSFLHVVKEAKTEAKAEKSKSTKKGDPKYMLNKLETALRNNRLRAKKQQKIDVVSTTSGEDSDDSLLFRSKSSRSLPKPPTANHDLTSTNNSDIHQRPDSLLGEFNCFNALSCDNPAYERIKEPSSSFFVPMDPIYAEPVQCRANSEHSANNRNSLYYMSTSLLNCNDENTIMNLTLKEHSQDGMDEAAVNSDGSNKKGCSDNSSLSSFTSDLEPMSSPSNEDNHAKIRYLIKNFDSAQRRTLPSRWRKTDDSQCSSSGENRGHNLNSSLKMSSATTLNNNNILRHKDPDLKYKNNGTKVSDLIAKFQTYQRTVPKYQKPNLNKNKLFYCCLIIERVKDCAQIKFKFPHDVTVPQDIEQLCFPESPDAQPLEGSSAAQTYTLLITNESGERTYGYCRRVLPEGSMYCLPLAYCILSKYRAPKFYKNILIELETRHGMQNKHRDYLFSQFYHKSFPKPGESICINLSRIEAEDRPNHQTQLEDSLDLTSFIHVNKTGEYGCLNNVKKPSIFVSYMETEESSLAPTFVSYEETKIELILTLNTDTRYEVADLKILHNLPDNIILKIFSSLLLERKVVLISENISELSSCVDSLQNILYPFTWYHTLIPILPESLWDIVESPTPVICGVLSPKAVEHRSIENGIVVNLNTKTVLSEEKDELDILSESMQRVWKQFITLANNTKSREYVYSVYLADAYLSIFISCLKNYKQFIVEGQFLKEQFIAKAKTKRTRRFLNMFTETCMFHAFIDTALNNPESLVTFDKKIELYGSDKSRNILEKLIEWNR